MAASDSEDPASDGEDDYLQEVAYLVPDGELDETTCTICLAEFLDAEDLKVHVKQVHKNATKTKKEPKKSTKNSVYSKVCQFCDATYRDVDAYARHVCNDHLAHLLCCYVCTKCFTDGGQWKKHERKHKNKANMFCCSQCTAVFSASKEVQVHEFIEHDNTDDGVLLNCMPHVSALLKQNVVAFLQSDDKNYTCSVCEFTTADIDSFLKHSKDCSVFVCEVCCYVTNKKRNLIKHARRKSKCKFPKECVSEMTTCPTCKTKVHCRQMQAHMNNCSKYKCYICDIRFVSIENLSKHQTEAHPVELDVIKCKFCYKEFVGEVSLEKHMKRSHSHQFILYKYKCKTCEQIFKHPQLLFAHYFTKHKELEPYTCRICDKKFKVRKRFTIHIKMEHKSAGVVEFDENYHVFFAEQKSNNPFIPKCVIPELVPIASSTPSIKVRTQKEINAEVMDKKFKVDVQIETEIDEENEDWHVEKPKQKTQAKKRKRGEAVESSSEEEAAPLSTIKKRAERKRFQRLFSPGTKLNKSLNQRRQFTCKTCNKYCYTFQNYQNHIQSHKKENVKCVKCSRIFKSRNKLSAHMISDHATSKLIETLKNVRERKQVETGYNDVNHDDRNDKDLTPSERFMKTIKKVKPDKQSISVTIAPTTGDLSVRNFIENFVPDVGETANVESTEMNDEEEEPAVTLKHYDSPFYRKHLITMTRFTPEPIQTSFKLKMPEKFKTTSEDKVKLKVKLVHEPIKVSMFDQLESFQSKFSYDESHDSQEYDEGFNIHEYDDANNVIPEVAQEVMLEGSEEPPKPNLQAPHKIVIPKLPEGYPKIHIATLQAQAPFYKIITVKNSQNANEAIVIDTERVKQEKPKQEPIKRRDIISLPDGTRFVAANPLAHLLGGKPVEELQVSTKYYKPAFKNFQGIFAEALQNLDKPTKKAKKKPESVDNTPEGNGLPESKVKTTESQVKDTERKVKHPESKVKPPEIKIKPTEIIVKPTESKIKSPEQKGKSPKIKCTPKGPGKSLPVL